MDIIVFENIDQSIGIVKPTDSGLAQFTIQEIAEKSTPNGLSFWIMDDSELPSDRTYRNLWKLDGTQGDPDGTGTQVME